MSGNDVPPPVVVDYATSRPRISPLATASLVSGLILVIPFVPGIIAIILGTSARRKTPEPGAPGGGQALAGIILGIVNLILWTCASAAAVPVVIQARHQAERIQCMSNLRQIGQACVMYATANRGQLPPSLAAINKTYLRTPLACPRAPGAPTAPNYVYLPPPRPLQKMKNAAYIVLAYEPLSNHGNGICVLYLDGHVAWLTAPKAQQTIANLNAGINPPP